MLLAVAQLSSKAADLVPALTALSASWSEAAALLAAPGGSGPEQWQKALEQAKQAAGKGAPGLKTAPEAIEIA